MTEIRLEEIDNGWLIAFVNMDNGGNVYAANIEDAIKIIAERLRIEYPIEVK
jgi:uncharacterized protein (DUF2164 family)